MKLLCVYVQTDTSLEWMMSVSEFFVSMGMHSKYFDRMLMHTEFLTEYACANRVASILLSELTYIFKQLYCKHGSCYGVT